MPACLRDLIRCGGRITASSCFSLAKDIFVLLKDVPDLAATLPEVADYFSNRHLQMLVIEWVQYRDDARARLIDDAVRPLVFGLEFPSFRDAALEDLNQYLSKRSNKSKFEKYWIFHQAL